MKNTMMHLEIRNTLQEHGFQNNNVAWLSRDGVGLDDVDLKNIVNKNPSPILAS
jgi:hypothetical protein